MRILHIMAGRGNGGAETYATDTVLALHEAGVEQTAVWHPAQARLPDLQRAGVITAPEILRRSLPLLRRWALTALVKKYKPDVIHCWMRRAASLVPKTAMPVIGWFGGYYNVRHFERCSHFVGVTPDIVAHQRDQGVGEGHSFFMPTFPAIDPSPAQNRAVLNTPRDAKLLLCLSRLHPKKGLDIMLQALARLPDCHLWLAGDGPLLEELQALAQGLNIADRVRFLGWRSDRGALLRAADICVLPSRYEPFGTVMLEAWAVGVPLVAAASAGPAGLIRNGENGLLVPVDDTTALADAIRSVIDQPDLRTKLCRGGQEIYEQQFTRAAVTRRWLELYEQIIREGRA